MSFESEIKNLIGNLNPNWYSALKIEFENHSCYDKESETIIEIFPSTGYSYDLNSGGELQEFYDVKIEINFNEYTWFGDEPLIDYIGIEKQSTVQKLKPLTKKIIQKIERLKNELTNLEDRRSQINQVCQFIDEAGNDLKEQFEDINYQYFIDNCLSKIKEEINISYKSIIDAHDTIQSFEDKLCFDLSEKELAFLFAVLIRCNFIGGYCEKQSTFHQFSRKYFYFRNQKKNNEYTRAINLNKKISDVLSPNNTDYNKIKKDMQAILNGVIEKL